MQTISRTAQLLWRALFLQREAYEELRNDDNPFVEGLYILVLIGLLIALVGIVGGVLEWASTPNLADIQRTVLDGLKQMDWYNMIEQEAGGEALQMFQQIFDANWQIVRALSPSPLSSLAGVVTKPLGLIIGWLIFGLIAHLLARLFGGTANLNQTLGVTALAAAPQLLTVVAALPFVTAAGVGVWTLLCRYMALRTAHQLSWPRAMWAALLPPIILGLAITILSILGAVIFGAALATLFTGGQ